MATLSKECTNDNLNRIADILIQLLQTNELTEFGQVQTSLNTVFKLNPKCNFLINKLTSINY